MNSWISSASTWYSRWPGVAERIARTLPQGDKKLLDVASAFAEGAKPFIVETD